MFLTDEQQAILNGSKGETMAKVMKTLVMYGDTFGADKMVPVTSDYNHLVTSFGLKMMKPVFDLMQQLIDAGALSTQKFSVDPRPVDKNVPANFLQNFIFNKIMYATQEQYEGQLKEIKPGCVIATDKNGMEFAIDADSVILSTGYRSAPIAQKAKNVHIVGDAAKVGNLRSVIWGVWDVCMKI